MTKIIVYHIMYGCESGCCGHTVEMSEEGPDEFRFAHPYSEDHRRFAEGLITELFGEEHVKDLDWENSLICDD